MRGIIRILMVLFVTAYLVVVLGFVGKQYEGVHCRGMNVIVRDSLERGLVSAMDIMNLVRLDHPEVAGMPLTSVDTRSIEESLNGFPAISNAQVYTNIQGSLIIEVSQRIPMARIEDRNHQRYYLDREGYVIPATLDYAPHILYINGEIPGRYRKEVKIIQDGEPEGDTRIMEDILRMATFIYDDPFWKSQIVQVYVNRNGEFELVPRVGSQIILFGNGDQMETKFFKLKTLYREGFSYTGWNQYEIINLKYKNQVICTKR